MTTIGDVVSRLRGQIKGEYQDAFLTDRFLYSVLKKHAQLLMRSMLYRYTKRLYNKKI